MIIAPIEIDVRDPRMRALLLTLFLAFATTGSAAAETHGLDESLALLLAWFPGEYDNNEQVWQQKEDGVAAADRHERIHHVFLAVEAPAIGEHVFFVKQYMDGDYEKVYRQRLYRFEKNADENAIELTIFSFEDEKAYRYVDRDPSVIRDITPAALKTTPGCEVYWVYEEGAFRGYMKDRACHFFSERLGKEIYITDTLYLDEDEIHIGDKAFDAGGKAVFGRDEPHLNRKVRYYGGWAAIKRQHLDAAAPADEWVFMKSLRLHNEGDRVTIIGDDGTPTGYSLELARLTYQKTAQPILKLGLIDDRTGDTITYIWGELGATRLGMNLRWMQAGITGGDSTR